jgi:hypothetical protein
MGWRQIDDLGLGVYDTLKDTVTNFFSWDTYVGLYQFGKAIYNGDISAGDLVSALGDSAKDKIEYFATNTKPVFSGDPSDEEVRRYGSEMGEILTMVGGSTAAIKLISKIAPKLAKILAKSGGKVASSLLKTEADTAFFWSGRTEGIGGAERALELANQRGGTTLEGLIESRGINMPEWDINNPNSIKAWEDVSATYANQVSGNVRAVVGSNLREGNIWENVELPRLMNNPNVSQITTIDPKTLVETIIFKR